MRAASLKISVTLWLVIAGVLALPTHAGPKLEVVASILPVHSLVAAVTAGVVAPALILPGNVSPHFHQLRPSQARALYGASVLFLIGPAMETFLTRSILNLSANTQVSYLMWAPGVSHLPNRQHRVSGHDEMVVPGDDELDGHSAHVFDSHIWLSPHNAAQMVLEISRVLSEVDSDNRHHYQRNANAVLARIESMDQEINAALLPIRDRPFVVFHDAYGYFETHYGLSVLGALSVNLNQPPSAKRVATVQRTIREHGAQCVFFEPQYNIAWAQTLAQDNLVRVGTLDPLGATLHPGPNAYFTLMQRIATAVIECLSG